MKYFAQWPSLLRLSLFLVHRRLLHPAKLIFLQLACKRFVAFTRKSFSLVVQISMGPVGQVRIKAIVQVCTQGDRPGSSGKLAATPRVNYPLPAEADAQVLCLGRGDENGMLLEVDAGMGTPFEVCLEESRHPRLRCETASLLARFPLFCVWAATCFAHTAARHPRDARDDQTPRQESVRTGSLYKGTQ